MIPLIMLSSFALVGLLNWILLDHRGPHVLQPLLTFTWQLLRPFLLLTLLSLTVLTARNNLSLIVGAVLILIVLRSVRDFGWAALTLILSTLTPTKSMTRRR